jgi:hypothetical protein
MVLCYKCGEYGYLGRGWAENSRRHSGDRYRTLYIRHYSSEKYHEMMEKYRSHEIKSRPNGQKRCYVPLNVKLWPTTNMEVHIPYCNIRTYRYSPKIYLEEGRVLYNVRTREVDENERLPKIYRSPSSRPPTPPGLSVRPTVRLSHG